MTEGMHFGSQGKQLSEEQHSGDQRLQEKVDSAKRFVPTLEEAHPYSEVVVQVEGAVSRLAQLCERFETAMEEDVTKSSYLS